MSTITEAVAHMEQLVALGCEYEEALADTQRTFELDNESMEMVENVYAEDLWQEVMEPLRTYEDHVVA